MILLCGSIRACQCVSSMLELLNVNCGWMLRGRLRKCVCGCMMRCEWCVQLQSCGAHRCYFINERFCSEQALPPLHFSPSHSLSLHPARSSSPLCPPPFPPLTHSSAAVNGSSSPFLSLLSEYLTSTLPCFLSLFWNCPSEDLRGQWHSVIRAPTAQTVCEGLTYSGLFLLTVFGQFLKHIFNIDRMKSASRSLPLSL